MCGLVGVAGEINGKEEGIFKRLLPDNAFKESWYALGLV
jgi:hypothetical protein